MLAYELEKTHLLKQDTPEGKHNMVLALTGDAAQAEAALIKAREAVKISNLSGLNINEQI